MFIDVDARRRLGLMRPADLARAAHGLISYGVGCAFGRWDIRVGQRAGETACQRGRTVASRSPGEAGEEAPDPAQGARGDSAALGDPFAPLPRCSPGMLQDADGRPLSPADLPANYPLRPPLDGILVDDPSEEVDITRVVRRALEALFGAATPAIAEELRTALGVDLRTYQRQSFFDAHLKAYSGSQRRVPLYWQGLLRVTRLRALAVLPAAAARHPRHGHRQVRRPQADRGDGGPGAAAT